MKKSSDRLIVILALVLLIGGGMAIYYAMAPGAGDPGKTMEQGSAEDLAVLDDAESSHREKYEALLRLAKSGSQEGLAKAKEYIDPQTPSTVRYGAALALGYYDDAETVEFITSHLDSEDPKLSQRLLEALAQKKTPVREQVIRNFLITLEEPSELKTAAQVNLLRVTTDPDEKDAILYALRSTILEQKAQSERWFMELLNAYPEEEMVLQLAREAVSSQASPAIVRAGIRHLASLKDEWLLRQFERLLKHPNPNVRVALVQSVQFSCPQERWTLLRQVLKSERNKEVLTEILKVPRVIHEEEGNKLLATALRNSNVSADLKAVAEESVAAIEEGPYSNPCK